MRINVKIIKCEREGFIYQNSKEVQGDTKFMLVDKKQA
ncbi:hypothetical protein LEP1GSC125_1462 [Leptospira mayottensis 200901122]|uniref:Uncharacterized protein n=1 Tax=Leptospira mayottensis 200901122 TaxID=1193010 RepID=A0AA87SZF8_9LEPT|nr:hypothetical protein LEP1GSC125_1462 [Leptospira mayottensis 200901122]